MQQYSDRKEPAERAFAQAFRLQTAGNLEEAERLYRRSIALYPTAEAFTFLAWTLSFSNRLEEAVQLCHRAIEIDPDFGNPYNDIGAYFIQLGRLEDAIPWLERAKHSKRYDCYHYPYYNLGRIYEQMGRFPQALAEYSGAVERAREKQVDYPHASHAVKRVEAILRNQTPPQETV
ncbi:MAG: tetratricopeptide repeat protein [Planctomycetes bacterium]|nr:tetratricopeptide repeat protein [Planctomycetota bacterium]